MASIAAPKPRTIATTGGAVYQPANVADAPLRIEQMRCRSAITANSGVHGIAQTSAETMSIAEITGVSASVVSDPPRAN